MNLQFISSYASAKSKSETKMLASGNPTATSQRSLNPDTSSKQGGCFIGRLLKFDSVHQVGEKADLVGFPNFITHFVVTHREDILPVGYILKIKEEGL